MPHHSVYFQRETIRRLCWLVVLFISFSQCSRNAHLRQLNAEIIRLQSRLATQPDATLDLKTAQQLIDRSQLYARNFPQDSLAPVYLFRAADVARGIGQYDLSVTLWEKVQQIYPGFSKVPDALFMQGFTYENNLKNTCLARQCYKFFLQRYPQHHLRRTVQTSLQQLDKTPAELIEQFKQQ